MMVGILLLHDEHAGRCHSTHTVSIRILAADIVGVRGQILLLPGNGLL